MKDEDLKELRRTFMEWMGFDPTPRLLAELEKLTEVVGFTLRSITSEIERLAKERGIREIIDNGRKYRSVNPDPLFRIAIKQEVSWKCRARVGTEVPSSSHGIMEKVMKDFLFRVLEPMKILSYLGGCWIRLDELDESFGQVYERAWRKFDKSGKTPFMGYLIRCLKHSKIDHGRRQKRRGRWTDPDPDSDSHPSPHHVENTVANGRVIEAIQRLITSGKFAEADVKILTLRMQQHTFIEIAMQMGWHKPDGSIDTARAQREIYRLRDRLLDLTR